jgi:hypothetical protein
MGGSQIFGFPMARRKVKATPSNPIPQTPTKSTARPLFNDPVAQGQSGSHTSFGTQGSQAEYKSSGVSKDPGLGRISASDIDTESGILVTAGDEEPGHLLFTIHQKASSQLLGNQNYDSSHNSESRVGQSARSLRGYGSSSTLRSFYDPQKIPLAVSQQTSNSSARDFALRKGCPPVVSIEKPVLRSSRSQKNPDVPLKSTKKTSSIRIDLSMLFPKPSARHDHLLYSQLGERHTDAEADQLVMPPAVPLGPSTSQKHRLNIVNPNKTTNHLRQSEESAPSIDNPDSSKMNMRKAKSGIKHWFDNFEDEDLEDVDQHENVEFRPPIKFSRDTQPPINIMPAALEAHDPNPGNTSLHHKVCGPEPGSNQPNLQIPIAMELRTISPAREQLRLALQSWESRNKHRRTISAKKNTTHIRRSRSNPFDKVDLRKDSVLCLSSSDDESEADDSLQSDIGTTIPGIRDSLIVAPSDTSDIEIGTAYAVKTKRPKLENDTPRRKSQVSGASESALKTMRVPERQSSRMFSFLSDQSRSLPNTQDGSLATSSITATSSELVGTYLHSPTAASQKHDSLIRLMTVTPQEESLLEAIRLKRASMHQNITAETVRRTSDGEQGESIRPPLRPQTSGFEANSASFLRLSQDSMPTVSAFHNHRRSISASEILEFNGTEPRNWSCSTDPITSRRGSLAHSSLPSSSSQESPPTPTLEAAPDTSTRRTSGSTKRYSTLPTTYQRHSRAMTGSSEVIVLDNLDTDSRIHFTEDDLPIWAFNGWPDSPGLAVVH